MRNGKGFSCLNYIMCSTNDFKLVFYWLVKNYCMRQMPWNVLSNLTGR